MYCAEVNEDALFSLGVRDHLSEEGPYWSEALELEYSPREIGAPNFYSDERDPISDNMKVLSDGKYFVCINSVQMHVWSFEEEEPLAREMVGYPHRRNSEAANRKLGRAERQVPELDWALFRVTNGLRNGMNMESLIMQYSPMAFAPICFHFPLKFSLSQRTRYPLGQHPNCGPIFPVLESYRPSVT